MNTKLSVIYFSATGGTANVVKGVAEGISNNYKEYNLTFPSMRENIITFDSDDLVIVGVPVYAGRVPKFLTDFFPNIKGNNTPAIFIAVYGNRDYDDALIELKDIFEANGFIGISAAAFIAEHSYTSKVATNRPDAQDLETAKKFGIEIKNKIENLDDILQLPRLTVKGKTPYKERNSIPPMAPDTSDNCISCGICAKHCPMGAISISDFKEVDSAKCIRCCSCVKKCPVNAKSINHELIIKITKNLIDNFSVIRKEPEFF